MNSNKYPNKETPINHPIEEILQKRWSPNGFSSEKIDQETINSLFEAARWAPSAFNEQPWRYIYATQDSPEQFEKISKLLMDGNSWAKNAFILVLICAHKKLAYNNKDNSHYKYDTGAATQNINIQAASLGLVTHEMAGFFTDKAIETYKLPEEIEPIAMMAIGKYDPSNLSDDLKQRESKPRTRNPIEEFVFKGEFKI